MVVDLCADEVGQPVNTAACDACVCDEADEIALLVLAE